MYKEKIRQLVANARLDDAVQITVDWANKLNDPLAIQSAIGLQGRWKQFQRERMSGILSRADERQSYSMIANHLLEMSNDFGKKNSLSILEKTEEKTTPTTHSTSNKVKNIVMLMANPAKTALLKLKDEYYMIQKSVQHHQDKFAVYSDDQVTPADILKAATHPDRQPWCLHFSGHGKNGDPKMRKMLEEAKRKNPEGKSALEDGSGLIVTSEDGRGYKIMPTRALDAIFKSLKRNVPSLELVVLNACYSEVQAETISKHGFYVVGTKNQIVDTASKAFSDVFYDTIAKGGTFKKAVEFGRLNALTYDLVDETDINLFFNGEKIDI
jgi:Effector-associated domain 11/CHAT domain